MILEPSLTRLGTGEISRETARRFNRLAQRVPVIMRLRERRGLPTQNLVSRVPLGKVLVDFWEALQWDAVMRLRRCLECRQWFADRTSNLRTIYCSRNCLNRANVRQWRQRQREKLRKAARQAKGGRTAARRAGLPRATREGPAAE